MELYGLQAGKSRQKYGKAATAILLSSREDYNWRRYVRAYYWLLLEMDMEQFRAFKYYKLNGDWLYFDPKEEAE